jgi:5'-phosphate synthase pdxT subunit
MRIGVVGLQGDVSEHVEAVKLALKKSGRHGDVVLLRRPEDLEKADAATIPGGESTTISKLLIKSGLFEPLRRRGQEGMPILGTCAGCILLSKEAGNQAEKTKTTLLALMDMEVDRNAFGRQKESFEAPLTIEGLDGPFKGVFIRAPAIVKVWGECRELARFGDSIVLARQGNLIGAAFHPELGGDTRFHEWFLGLI